ncbi:MAG: F0F1 ATP synthase subunit gamma [Sulfuricurvum sp. GWF2_44_89]|uniref:ATP synthase gamma chain n=1 Tax=Sulfuricurvum kujiense TaxID=148813 RepID=A0A2D3W8M6_9BACT|nr:MULTISPECIES: ATP synthase F1 subunit gamma [Sulfuricurvum]OHD79568.1 MAG: F0F1 ATP synthase subunit gamma [Sulfuricurvum sp. GWF2_44_89]OHD94362.1 MAG: F0F1 ATP synthase subunit gamma [Sulfuricurvum sp. RIFOXYD12_FULL_44_77]OHD99077.1 MAG: F0F1 ATP synthase subunit gamma [Sulfuricurvum sp. RIFOXYD2_FULL_44_160]DAB37692.1 MAG TPA: F0F1 ATP synthase subunit gamma [Sulfuricurvum kujiense]
MANLKEIQRQIKSVSNTQKTTRAMKLVSTAKLRRAEELAKRSRLFAQKTNQVIAEIAGRIKCNKVGGIENRCFIENDAPEMIDIIFVTADKGLCGGFNMQTIKAVKRLMSEYKNKKVKIRLRGIGKKGIEFFTYNEVEMLDVVKNLSSAPDMQRSSEFMTRSINDFKEGKIDAVYLVYNGYKNVITQELHVNRVLPVNVEGYDCEEAKNSMLELEAQDEEKMLDSLVTKYAEYNMYYALIDSLAAEHSARMQAMDAATNNAKEMVNSLKVKFNKARQEAITTELIEIISGVESMK